MTDREQLKEELQALAEKYEDTVPHAAAVLFGLAGMIVLESEQEISSVVQDVVRRTVSQIKAFRN